MSINQIEGEASSFKPKDIDVRRKFGGEYARRGIVPAQ